MTVSYAPCGIIYRHTAQALVQVQAQVANKTWQYPHSVGQAYLSNREKAFQAGNTTAIGLTARAALSLTCELSLCDIRRWSASLFPSLVATAESATKTYRKERKVRVKNMVIENLEMRNALWLPECLIHHRQW